MNLLATVGIQLSREQTLFGVTGLVLVPLCLLKDLSSLAPFSLLGIMGMAYTAIAMAVRFFGGDYRAGGRFFKDVVVSSKPLFGNKGAMSVFSPSSFILISMLSTAYMVSLLTFSRISDFHISWVFVTVCLWVTDSPTFCFFAMTMYNLRCTILL